MTHIPISCEQFDAALADLLAHEADDMARDLLEQHARACAPCGALLADLRKLRVDAANLPELAPSRDLWEGVEARIQAKVVPLGAPTAVRGAPKRRALWLGLAAAGLVAATATITREVTKRSVADSLVARASTAPRTSTPLVSVVATTTEQAYAPEIARLRGLLAARRPRLDSTTVAVIERNLTIIDDAIAECKAALRADPASKFLIESLNEAFDDKVRLLQTAVQLPAST